MNKYNIEVSSDNPFPQAIMRRYAPTDGPKRVLAGFMQLVASGTAFEVFYVYTQETEPVPSRRGTEQACREVMAMYEKQGIFCIFEGIEANGPLEES